ncbi:hypothetical protein VKI21_12715 [Cyanobacterium aponinum UTEX 3222]|nr:hypothetical protein [Cyanobacterium aponinum]MBD2394258.1 hypothetical protein [Cyanobacterium aponinum FACHB-4101]WPF90331.1 hypothetical protein SAY89_08690 [Cyanobacterium aponinum AL20115]WRL40919.1 hypothetical protein VKI21_12715 [Cyanobacterium aponinum UTEX 3222]
MKTITLRIDDRIKEQFISLLKNFSENELRILEESEYISDDEYLRSLSGMVESIKEARKEPIENGVTLEELDW